MMAPASLTRFTSGASAAGTAAYEAGRTGGGRQPGDLDVVLHEHGYPAQRAGRRLVVTRKRLSWAPSLVLSGRRHGEHAPEGPVRPGAGCIENGNTFEQAFDQQLGPDVFALQREHVCVWRGRPPQHPTLGELAPQ